MYCMTSISHSMSYGMPCQVVSHDMAWLILVIHRQVGMPHIHMSMRWH